MNIITLDSKLFDSVTRRLLLLSKYNQYSNNCAMAWFEDQSYAQIGADTITIEHYDPTTPLSKYVYWIYRSK